MLPKRLLSASITTTALLLSFSAGCDIGTVTVEDRAVTPASEVTLEHVTIKTPETYEIKVEGIWVVVHPEVYDSCYIEAEYPSCGEEWNYE